MLLGDGGMTTHERSQLDACIQEVYRRAATDGTPPRESVLQEVLRSHAADAKSEGSAELGVLLDSLADRLSLFCGEGSYAYLLDRETTVPSDPTLVVFDTRRLPEVMLTPVVFVLTEYVKRQIEAYRDASVELASRPDAPMFAGRTLMAIDETWALIGRQETGSYIQDLARRSRHLGLFLIATSQHLSDFNTEHGLALLRAATMQLFLRLHPEELEYVSDALRLSEAEVGLISRLKTVKGRFSQAFWVNGTRGRGQVSLRVGGMELWAATSDPVKDAPLRAATIERHGGNIWRALTELAERYPTGAGGPDGEDL